MRTKSWRANQARLKQLKRLKQSSWFKTKNQRHIGRLKNNHLGCGCAGCKPWKHKLASKYKISEQRTLQKED